MLCFDAETYFPTRGAFGTDGRYGAKGMHGDKGFKGERGPSDGWAEPGEEGEHSI
jgi:hypothetical protein